MVLSIDEFTEEDAKNVCSWRYPSPYDIYNCPNWETILKQNWGMTNDTKRSTEFYSVRSKNQLIGFFRLIKHPEFVMISLGLAPDMCGLGIGKQLMDCCKKTLLERYPGLDARLEVRDFNVRAFKCYKNAGFVIIEQMRRETPIGMADFFLMQLV